MQEALDQLDEDDLKAPRWRFMVPRAIGDGKTTYLWRLYILSTPWFSVMFHRIFRPDNQRELHDHPWSFVSFVLRGFYRETIGDCVRQCSVERRWINFKWAEDRHSINYVSRKPIWTLVFTGPRRRKWGFWVRDPKLDSMPGRDDGERWVAFDEYDKLNDA